jgi:hypothetical protein
MADTPDDEGFKPQSFTQIVSQRFLKPAAAKNGAAPPQDRVLNATERRVAMKTIDAVELKWCKSGLVLAAIVAVFLPFYAAHFLHSAKDKQTSVTTEALIVSGVVLFFCLLGLVGLRRRKRSFLAFTFFIVGFAMTLTFPPIGFALIFLGAWLMLRAWRLQKYGTANMKMVAKEAATRPTRKARQEAAKAPVKPTGYAAPKANKRYTPKAPSKKKRIEKPVE